MKISIIIPVYNVEDYIERCLESVVNQTYKDLEIIVINDGSTDQSGKICDEYATKDNRIKVIHKVTNSGVAMARNAGLCVATGNWIGFIDSDDYVDKEMYERLIKVVLNQNVDIVACKYYLVNGTECVMAENKKEVPKCVVDTKVFLRYIYERDVYKGVAGYVWSRIFRRNLIFDDSGNLKVRFLKEYTIGEDVVFLAEILKNSEKSIYIDEPLYYYIQRKDSLAHNELQQLVDISWARAYLKVLDIYKSVNLDEEVKNIIIRMFVFRCATLAQISIKYDVMDRYFELKEMIDEYKDIYCETNKNYPERLQWLKNILSYGWNK